jgi:hypothetical protein
MYLFLINYTSFGISAYYYFSDMFQPIKVAVLRKTVYTKGHLKLKHIFVECACYVVHYEVKWLKFQ